MPGEPEAFRALTGGSKETGRCRERGADPFPGSGILRFPLWKFRKIAVDFAGEYRILKEEGVPESPGNRRKGGHCVKNQKRSLKLGLLATIVICWIVPILIIVSLAGILISRSYRQNMRQEVEASAKNALWQAQIQLENAIGDSKAVSYDGVIRRAYRSYLTNGNRILLYRNTNDYLNQNFGRDKQYQAVSIHFWDKNADVNVYLLSSGITGYELLHQCQENTPRILEEMADADTDIRFLLMDGQMYMARNLLDNTFTPYASIVMMLNSDIFFRPLASINRIQDPRIGIDGVLFTLDDKGTLEAAEAPEDGSSIRYRAEVDGHSVSFSAGLAAYDLWRENPWLIWDVCAVALLVLPLLVVVISLFYRHVTGPMTTLVQANLRVQSGDRGYQITQDPPNAEFETLYGHFNDMSAELKNQFERAYLEQQATQKAQIKALQSQINPHFLNNTLEIINWEARLADNERVCAMIEALSTMLNAALDRDGRTLIPLKEELGYVDAYLYIIRQRQGDKFRVEKQIEPRMLEQMIPRLILQPIVENAVEHDISDHHGGKISLRARREEACMVLEVEHDGSMTEADRENIRVLLSSGTSAEKGRVGLVNVYRRLKLQYGEAGGLTIEEVRPGSILARIRFPCSDPGNP